MSRSNYLSSNLTCEALIFARIDETDSEELYAGPQPNDLLMSLPVPRGRIATGTEELR